MKRVFSLSGLLTLVTLGCGSPTSSTDPQPSILAQNAPVTCTIQTTNGRYLTAVGGGGRITDVLHSDATRVGAWERFTLVDSGDGSALINYGIKTVSGHYLTAVSGGGRTSDVIHSDATKLLAWEKFTLIPLGGGIYGIRTVNGHYLTAIGGGGRITDVVHSDATSIKSWEKFRFACTNP